MEDFRPCRVSTISKIGRFAALCFYPFIGVGLIFVTFLLAIEVLASDNHTAGQLVLYILTTITTILLSIWLFTMSKNCYQMESRHISIDTYGFAMRKRVSNQYTWEMVESIGVIAYAADANKELFQTEICIFLTPANDVALRKLRDSYLYGAFNMDKYVLLDYDPILHKELEECSGLSVEDLRSHQLKI